MQSLHDLLKEQMPTTINAYDASKAGQAADKEASAKGKSKAASASKTSARKSTAKAKTNKTGSSKSANTSINKADGRQAQTAKVQTKININTNTNPDRGQSRPYNPVSKEEQEFLQHPLIKEFMASHNINRSFILDQLPIFKQYVKEKEACSKCSSLMLCTRKMKGSIKTPVIDEDGSFNTRYEACDYQVEEEKKLRARKNYLYSHLSLSDYGLNQKSLGDTKSDREYTLVALEVLVHSHQNNQGLLLYGNPGAGKSYLYKILANSLALSGKSVCFVFMPQLIRELRSEMEDKIVQKRIMHNLISCDVLFLDDFGSELVSKWSRDDILLVILDARLNAHKLTYFSSNYALNELARQYLLDGDKDAMARDRLLDRIRALARPLQLKGASRR